jgi:diacylglycerol O-acyltransferase / wax synthase
MSPLDAAFWQLEDRNSSLHVASTALFAAPAPSLAAVRGVYRRKLHRVPRLRQRPRWSPFGLRWPRWADDPQFDLTQHVRRLSIAAPGGVRELTDAVGRLMSTHLDPGRPLWEVWLVDGLADGRWAIVSKLHHSMVDGIAGLGVLTDIFDGGSQLDRPGPDQVDRVPGPSTVVAATHALITTVRGLKQYLAALALPGPRTDLTGPLGVARDYSMACIPLSDVDAIRHERGGTVNDVVLALATGAFRRLLEYRHEDVVPHAVRCLVPVSTRAIGNRTIDNQVSAVLLDLPVEFGDATTRYEATIARTAKLKGSAEADAGATMVRLAGWLPPGGVSLGLRTVFHMPQRSITTVVTNVPGPESELSMLGRPMVGHFPYVPIADRIRIGVAVTSYDGRLFFGITTDKTSVPDARIFVEALERGVSELSSTTAKRGQA